MKGTVVFDNENGVGVGIVSPGSTTPHWLKGVTGSWNEMRYMQLTEEDGIVPSRWAVQNAISGYCKD